jgi:hypothetical protein
VILGTTRPTTREDLAERARATELGTYPSSLTAFSMAARVGAPTYPPLKNLETVAPETPARWATSCMVAMCNRFQFDYSLPEKSDLSTKIVGVR